MPTLAKIRDTILSQLAGHAPGDDERLRIGLVDQLIADKRALLANQAGRLGLGIDADYYQVIDCLRIEKGEIQCDGEATGVIERYIMMPGLLSASGSVAYLGTIDGKQPFQYKPITAFLRGSLGRFCEERPSYTLIGDKAYLKDAPPLTEVRLIAALADPAENKCILDFENTDYPVPAHIVHQLEVLVLKQLASTLPVPPDVKNDAADLNQQPANLQRGIE